MDWPLLFQENYLISAVFVSGGGCGGAVCSHLQKDTEIASRQSRPVAELDTTRCSACSCF